DAIPGVTDRLIVARHGGADGSPGYSIARLSQAHEGTLDARGTRKDGIRRQAYVRQVQLARIGRAEGQLSLLIGGGKARRAGRDDEPPDGLGVVDRTGLGPDDRHRGL